MKKLALAAMLLASTAAYAADEELPPVAAPPPARVTVAPQIYGPPPIGWVYGPHTQCADPTALLHGHGERTGRWAQRSRRPQWTPGDVTGEWHAPYAAKAGRRLDARSRGL